MADTIYQFDVFGPENSGKTTLLETFPNTVPAGRFSYIKTCQVNESTFRLFNKHPKTIRLLYAEYYYKVSGLILVLDSSDSSQLEVVKTSFLGKKLLEENGIELPLLILANKQDKESAMGISQLAEILEPHIQHKNWTILPCSTELDNGVKEGLEWLLQQVKEQNQTNKSNCIIA